MTTKELISQISSETGMPRQKVAKLMTSTTQVIMDALLDNKSVMLQNFGTLEVRTHQPRSVVNPKTGERSQTQEKRTISFRANRQLKTDIR